MRELESPEPAPLDEEGEGIGDKGALQDYGKLGDWEAQSNHIIHEDARTCLDTSANFGATPSEASAAGFNCCILVHQALCFRESAP